MTETKNPILTVERELRASAEAAFAAWTEPEQVRQWWGGWQPGTAPEMQIDATFGAPYRFAMALGDRTQWVLGEIMAVEAPRRLEFSFAWEGVQAPPTPVVVAFEDTREGCCTVRLVHDQSAGGNACEDGWGWSLGCLADYLERRAGEPG